MTRDSETIPINLADIAINMTGSYRAPESRLEYQGCDFDKYAISLASRRIGEVDVQRGKTEVTIRNVILYDEAILGRGIGKAVYALLQQEYPKKTLRSSLQINLSGSHATTGLSQRAVALWDSFVSKGLAKKTVLSDGRFYYVATGRLDAALENLQRDEAKRKAIKNKHKLDGLLSNQKGLLVRVNKA